MITLYTKTGCPYCDKVKDRIAELALPYSEKNISDEKNLSELLEKGGKRQVPFMIDDERGTSMYESGDIIYYLENLPRSS